MIVKLSDYIVSPLAMGTSANYERIKAGKTMLRRYVGKWGLPDSFVASMMDDDALSEACRDKGISVSMYTRFERMTILAAACALQRVEIQPDDERVLFILATTKGNVELLDGRYDESQRSSHLLLADAARQVTGWFRNPNAPIIVCNACISGLSAQIEAMRILASGEYDCAVVIGADVLSPFIVSGFQSFKSMSTDPCRPFDEERYGLNLGEAAACVVYGRVDGSVSETQANRWSIAGGVVRNDAFHISSPSKTAEGAYRALRTVLEGQDDFSGIASVNVHGTATLFNDEMEAVAIDRMQLNALPAFGLKGYYGHTMGAAGVLETLIAMEALDDHAVPATKGFEHIGVSRNINISGTNRNAEGTAFLKMMSGFGGCNAAMLFERTATLPHHAVHTSHVMAGEGLNVVHTVHLTEQKVWVDGELIPTEGYGLPMLKALYHARVGDYPKFYKMDPLSQLGFIASELLLQAEAQAEDVERFSPREDRAVLLMGRSASICADRAYQQTIQHADDYFPSPAAFVYTLPNIVTGEIAIRNRYHGETSYIVQDTPERMNRLMLQALHAPGTHSVLGGWIDVERTDKFETTLYIIKE